MSAVLLCKRYLAALASEDLPEILQLFTPGAVIESPLFGNLDPESYHRQRLALTSESFLRLKHLDEDPSGRVVTLHCHYTWVLKTGRIVQLEVSARLELNPEKDKFIRITLSYDPSTVRAHLIQRMRGLA